jgi:ABC-type nickel/cobalt efflux system permease component RcnA
MSGLDDRIAHLPTGGLLTTLLVALLLGARHATDPDHLTALATLTLGEDRRRARRAGVLGLAWGAGHATTLVAFGLPVVVFHSLLPGPVQAGAEVAVGCIVAALAIRLIVRWRRGYLHLHPHSHDGVVHAHRHVHEHPPGGHAAAHEHGHVHGAELGRSPLTAFGIGLVHGVGGSAAVGVLLIGAIGDRAQAVVALVLFAAATAMAMGVLSAGFGRALTGQRAARRLEALTPALAAAALAFGGWYAAAALDALAPVP